MSNKTDCRGVKEMLERFLDGELSPQEHDRIRDELARCEECRQQLDRLQKLRALIREVYVEEVRRVNLDAVLPGVMERIRQEKPGWRQSILSWLERYQIGLVSPAAPLGVAAALAAAVIAGTLIYATSGTPEGPEVGKTPVQIAADEPAPPAEEEGGTMLAGAEGAADVLAPDAAANRRSAHEEKPFKRNECYVTYYQVDSGTVIVDVDPDGDAPAVVWHFEGEESPEPGEDNRI
jgi:anti-sigma factor RsiW